MLNKPAKTGMSFSLIAGTLLVPLTALAALWLTNPDPATKETSATTIAAPQAAVAQQEVTTTVATDLLIACGPEGMQLASLEKSGTITVVQQGALDALRGVCEQQGLPLPAKPAAEPIIRTVLVPAMTGSSATATRSTTFDDEDANEHEDHEDHEDHEEDD